MTTEVWYRNPTNYVRELAETGARRVVWDMGMLVKRNIDAAKFANLYFGTRNWRTIITSEEGSCEIDRDGKVVAAYPTWVYGEDIQILEDLIANPIGEREDLINDMGLPKRHRPVAGQEHRVIIHGVPGGHTGPGKAFYKLLHEMQANNLDCILHVHGPYSYTVAFGSGVRAADMDPRMPASKGKLCLPNGTEVQFDDQRLKMSWITMFGQKYSDMAQPRERCMYNIRSAEYAGKSFGMNIQPLQRPNKMPDIHTADSEYITPRSTLPFLGSAKALPGDKFFCNDCSLAMQCKLFREGSVCTLPSAETQELVKLFGSRKSDDILTGMSKLMQMGAERLGARMEQETENDEVSPEVTKMMNTLFDQGAKLAKLTDPALRGGVNVKVGVAVNGGGGAAALPAGTGSPRQLIAGVMREFEMQGFSRDEITPAMVAEALAAMGQVGPTPAQEAIRGEILGS